MQTNINNLTSTQDLTSIQQEVLNLFNDSDTFKKDSIEMKLNWEPLSAETWLTIQAIEDNKEGITGILGFADSKEEPSVKQILKALQDIKVVKIFTVGQQFTDTQVKNWFGNMVKIKDVRTRDDDDNDDELKQTLIETKSKFALFEVNGEKRIVYYKSANIKWGGDIEPEVAMNTQGAELTPKQLAAVARNLGGISSNLKIEVDNDLTSFVWEAIVLNGSAMPNFIYTKAEVSLTPGNMTKEELSNARTKVLGDLIIPNLPVNVSYEDTTQKLESYSKRGAWVHDNDTKSIRKFYGLAPLGYVEKEELTNDIETAKQLLDEFKERKARQSAKSWFSSFFKTQEDKYFEEVISDIKNLIGKQDVSLRLLDIELYEYITERTKRIDKLAPQWEDVAQTGTVY